LIELDCVVSDGPTIDVAYGRLYHPLVPSVSQRQTKPQVGSVW